MEKDGRERLYFVVETKSSTNLDDLREPEKNKVKCGRAHFKALEEGDSPAKYILAKTLADVLNDI